MFIAAPNTQHHTQKQNPARFGHGSGAKGHQRIHRAEAQGTQERKEARAPARYSHEEQVGHVGSRASGARMCESCGCEKNVFSFWISTHDWEKKRAIPVTKCPQSSSLPFQLLLLPSF